MSTKTSWPSSTPTLKKRSARGISTLGMPVVERPLAKPNPCSSPNRKATTQGYRIVRLVSPFQERTISGPRKRIDNAMAVPKIYTIGPMFRRERPQKGRYRQFHQLDVEVFGVKDPSVDGEVIDLAWTLIRELG
ncbi:MAG: hypothetical protein HGB17_11685, partial [Syntrophobacteraceae bacterium]|nr:hypothetical protein [Syntrophobacteraceae bacterium]